MTAYADLGMYPFDSVAWAWDHLWTVVHERAPWTPPRLARTGDVHASWDDPNCVVTHVCGWPLAAFHAEHHRVIGNFQLSIPEADGSRYRSVLVSPHDRDLADLVSPNTRAVANSDDSLSGWVSLLNATVGPDGHWPGTALFTSAHRESLAVLQRGDADLAAIDPWSLEFIERELPELTLGLHRVGLGPLVLTPAITTRSTVSDADANALAEAFAAALNDPSTLMARHTLHITGFSRPTIDDYRRVLTLSTRSPSVT